jgi:hypothetical protein
MTAETWPAAGAHEDPIRPQWVGNMDDRYLFADPSSAYSLHAVIDPAIRERWMEVAEAERDQRPRPWVLEYRTALAVRGGPGYVSVTNLRDLTAAQAWARFEATTQTYGRLPVGARLVLLAAPGSAGIR